MFRKSRTASCCTQATASSEAHRHHDVTVLALAVAYGAQHALALGILELELHLLRADRLQELDQVLGVEADLGPLSGEVDRERLARLAEFGRGRAHLDLAGLERQPHRTAAFRGEQ